MTTRTINFLPDVFKTPANQKFLNATLDQLVTEPQFKKLNGYIGRKFAPTFNKTDNYLPENSRNRTQYQLEPSVVVTDEIKNVKFFASYTDLLNKIYYYGGNISNHSRLFENEAYSYDGMIDFDKLINFNQYYWIPEGPAAIEIYTGAVNLFDDFVVTRNDRLGAYQISGFGSVENPTITLARGGTYTFQLNQPGSNFWIQTEPGLAGKQRYQRNISTRDVLGVDRNGADNGVVTFTVPQADAQDFFKRMPTLPLSESDRSLATNLTYDQIDSQLWSNIVAKFGGIDGITDASLLQNTPRIIFLQNLIEPTTWNDAGVYNRADYGVEKYDEGQDIPQSKQFDIWQINLEPTDDGDYIVNIDWNATFPVSNKIHITTGNENAGRDFYRKDLSTIELVPALTAEKDLLFFNDGTDQRFYGQIKLVNDTSSIIDVTDIIGKKQYSIKVGEKTLTLSNGMKIKFNAAVTPASYINNFYYVEGVGKSIRLVKTDLMQTPELDFKGITTIPFDIYGYSIDNFDQILNGPTNPDYITINRSSVDANAWSRSNRWFHQDIILQSAIFNNVDPDYNQALRATRPIIEFDPDLQLFNNGRVGVNNIDVVDFSITNALLNIEGEVTISTYFTDLKFSDGMTVIFANDKDPTVRNRIYKVRIVSVNDEVRVHLVKVGDISPYDVVTPRMGITLPLIPLLSTTPYEATYNHNNRQIDITAVGASNFKTISDISLDGVMSPTIGITLGHSFWFNGNTWTHAQQKTNINTMPLFDVVDENLVSFSDQTVYANTEFAGSPIFSYTLGSGVTDSVLGFPIAYRSIANTGDILFTNNVDADSFNYLSGITTTSIKLNTGFVPVIASRFQLNKKNVWVTEDQNTKQYQLFSNICDGVTSYYEIDITPTNLTNMPSVFLYINGTLIQERDSENNTQYEIVKVGDVSSGVPAVLTLYVKYPIVKDDRVDFLIYSTTSSNIGYYEIPENLELNALNESFSHITLGQMRKHVLKIAEKSPELVGVPLASNNLRDLDIKSRGGNILQHSSPMIYSSLFLLNDEVSFMDSIRAAQFEYSKFKYKFLENAGEIAANRGNVPATVDAIMLKINAVNNIQMPWYYSDMVPYDQNKKVIEYTVLATEILEYEIPTIFDDTKLSNQAILVYVNGIQLIKNHDYEFSKTRPSIVFKHLLEYDDVINIVIYANTDGCYVPETPTKLGLYPKFTPEIFIDDTYLTPIQVIRGHDGSITPAFGDVRDELLLELEKRIYNNIKATYDPLVFDINSIVPERFRNTGYIKSEFDNIISSSYTQWLGSNRVAITTNDWFDEKNFFTWNYSSNRIFNADLRLNNTVLPGYWRGIFLFLYGTDAPHTRPWESLGFSEKPEWWETYYGVAPYTGGNLVLWGDLEQGLIREGPRAGINKLYARPGVTNIIPVTDSGELRSPVSFLTHVPDTGTAKAPFNMGDVGPIESAWRRSSDYPFAVQQAIALMRPSVYFGSLASIQKYRRHPATNQFFIEDTKQKITPLDFVFNGENIDDTIMRNAGYTNWIVDYATSRGVNPSTLLHKYVDRVSINLGYKVAGFTDKNYLKIYAEQSNPNSANNSVVIPDENYKVYLHKSSPVSVINYSALVITSTPAGFTVSGYNVSNPIFKIIPSNTASAKHTVTVLNLAGTIYEGWEDAVVDIPYGQEFRNTQQVVDFIVSYGRYLISLGLQFKTFDQSLGEERNWELSVKEFLTWAQQGWGNGSLLVLSPLLNEFTVIHPAAVVDKIENSRLGSKILDVGFNFIPPKQSSIVRNDGVFSITTPADRTIGLVSLALVQYEHVLIFDNQTEFKDIIYAPALGNRQYRLKLIGNKTDNWTGQLSLPGFMHTNADIAGWEVFRDYNKGEIVQYKGNIYTALAKILASDNFDFTKWKQVDSTFFKSGIIPNLAYGAGRFENMYDIDGQVQDNNLNSLSDGLIGNQSRSYLIDLGISPTSQSKFYQGFIKDKGTHAAISALGDLSINHITGKIAVTEEWAFRVGEYGALESNQFLEVQLGEALFKQDPVAFNLQNPGDELQSENSVTMYYNTLYKKPLTFRPNFLNDRDDSVNSENDFPSAGYVHLDDIDATIFDLSNPAFIGDLASKVYSGFKIWVAKNLDGDWDVLRVSESQIHITNADYNLDGIAEFTTDLPHKLSVGEVFVIKNFSADVDNFYRVYRITSMHTVYATISSSLEATMISTPNMEGYGTLFNLSSMRVDELIEVANLTPKFSWKDGDKVWADKNTINGWAVYNKTSPWKYSSDLNELGVDNKPIPLSLSEQYGSTIASNEDGSIVIVGSPGQIGKLPRPFIKNYLGLYEISPGTTDTEHYRSADIFGKAIAIGDKSIAISSDNLEYYSATTQSSILTYLLGVEGSGVQKNTLYDTAGIKITGATLVSPGVNYTSIPEIVITPGYYYSDNGSGSYYVDSGKNLEIEIVGEFVDASTALSAANLGFNSSGVSGYTCLDNFTVNIAGGGGTGARAELITERAVPLTGIPVDDITLTVPDNLYDTVPTVSIAAPEVSGGIQATASLTVVAVPESFGSIEITLTSLGSNYTLPPEVVISAPTDPLGIQANAVILGNYVSAATGSVTGVTMVNAGDGYQKPPFIVFTGDGSGAAAHVTGTLVGAKLASVALTDVGLGYTSKPYAQIFGASTDTSRASIEGALNPSTGFYEISGITLTDPGAGYLDTPVIEVYGGGTTFENIASTIIKSGVATVLGAAGSLTLNNSWITNAVSKSFFNPYATLFAGVYVLVDLGVNAEHSLYISSNGVNWVENMIIDNNGKELFLGVPIIANNKLYALACQRSIPPDYAAITSNTIWLISTEDGKTWTAQETNMKPILETLDLSVINNLDITYVNNKFAITQLNETETDTLLTSDDGIIWQAITILPAAAESVFPVRAYYW